MVTVDHEVLTSLTAEAGYFDELDDRLGPAGSRARLLSLEGDSRWDVRYHKFTHRGTPVAVVPVYRRRAKEWPSPLYTPAFEGQRNSPVPPGRCAVVGGRDGMISSLHVRADMRRPGVYRSILTTLSGAYRERGMHLYLPHFRADELDLISSALDTLPRRELTGADARLDGLFGEWGQSLLSKQRATLRHDLADSARLGVQTAVCGWDDVADHAAPLIASHYQAKGTPEHGLLVDRRVREWARCPEFEIMAFTAGAGDVQGVLVALIWRDWMDLLEIGMSHGHSEVRRCVYAQLIAHIPAAVGKARGLRKLRAGPAARMAKAARGAFFYDLESALVPPATPAADQAGG